MDKYEIEKAKALRGDIIKTLYELLEKPVPAGTLRSLLRYKSYNGERDIKRAFGYLAGKGKEYIEIDVNSEDYWASEIRLTPSGVNLAEGDKPEEMGVALDE